MFLSAMSVTVNEALSGIFGSISMTAWICLLLPQLITNYKAQSADGLSMAFLAVWLIGDVANLAGALVTGLAPAPTALAGYFCISDIILISQTTYYNTISARRRARERALATAEGPADEEEPLLRRGSSNGGLPGSHRRALTHQESNLESLRRVVTGEDETPDSNPWLHNTISVMSVYIVGAAGWFVSYKVGAFDGPAAPDAPSAQSAMAIVGVVLGYTSAVCYLFARLPQIYKNYKEKSCEGLALLFFLLSLTGNLTYGASVFSYSQDPGYLIKAIPWLLGSFGTIVEDCIIFVQFRLYSPKKEPKANGVNGINGAQENGWSTPPPAYAGP